MTERPTTPDQVQPRADPPEDGTWLRVHPLTPYIRSWLLIVALVWGVGNVFLDDLVSAVVRGEPLEMDVAGTVQSVGVVLLAAVICGVLAVVVGLGVLSWWFTRYQITAEHVRFRSGMLFRTQRQARLDRVQGIDIERSFLPRVFGLASLKFDVADGGSSALELSYLRRDEARELRHRLLVAVDDVVRKETAPPRRAPWDHFPETEGVPSAPSQTRAAEGPVVERTSREVRAAERLGLLEDQGRRVFTVPTSRVLLSMLLSWGTIVLVGFLVVAVVVVAIREPDSLRFLLPSYIPVLVGVVSGLYNRLEHGWGFTLAEVPAGVRVRYGLFNERSSTIPAGRVQALQVSEPMLWRPFHGHRVVVITAGKDGVAGGEDLDSVVLPVGSRQNVNRILELVLPLAQPPVELVRSGLDGTGEDDDYTTSPRRARWLDPLTWRRTGFAMDHSVLALRWGRLNRHVSLIPHHKTQSFGWEQGPLERRMGLADVHVHMIPGAVTTRLSHLDARVARELQTRLAEVARSARERMDRGSTRAGGATTHSLPPDRTTHQEDTP